MLEKEEKELELVGNVDTLVLDGNAELTRGNAEDVDADGEDMGNAESGAWERADMDFWGSPNADGTVNVD